MPLRGQEEEAPLQEAPEQEQDQPAEQIIPQEALGQGPDPEIQGQSREEVSFPGARNQRRSSPLQITGPQPTSEPIITGLRELIAEGEGKRIKIRESACRIY